MLDIDVDAIPLFCHHFFAVEKKPATRRNDPARSVAFGKSRARKDGKRRSGRIGFG